MSKKRKTYSFPTDLYGMVEEAGSILPPNPEEVKKMGEFIQEWMKNHPPVAYICKIYKPPKQL